MKTRRVAWLGQVLALHFPDELASRLDFVLRGYDTTDAGECHRLDIGIAATPSDPNQPTYELTADGRTVQTGLSLEACVRLVADELVRCFITDLSAGVALHAACLARDGLSVLLPGPSGAGKSSLTAWLTTRGFEYCSDEIAVLLPHTSGALAALPRPLVIKNKHAEWLNALDTDVDFKLCELGDNLLAWPASVRRDAHPPPCRLCVFPTYAPGQPAALSIMSPGDAALALMGLNANARNLADHGFASIIDLAQGVTAFRLRYSDFSQIEGMVDLLLRLAGTEENPETIRKVFEAAIGTASETKAEPRSQPVSDSTPPPTPRPSKSIRKKPRLTIGMATIDDYDGVYFSIQSLRMFHPEIMEHAEIIVVDNNPYGACAPALKKLEGSVNGYRYIPYGDHQTNMAKGVVFDEANAELVLCIDSHVLIVPGALARLLDFADRHGSTLDLWQGPMLNDNLNDISTHWEPKWGQSMFGTWATDPRGQDVDAEPFEIEMHGMGLFACHRSAWPGFNPLLQGRTVEEGYIHEKIRRNGGKVYCLPFLRWLHRFQRPFGVPYDINWENVIRNYVVCYRELGLPLDSMTAHFQGLIGDRAGAIIAAANDEIDAVEARLT